MKYEKLQAELYAIHMKRYLIMTSYVKKTCKNLYQEFPEFTDIGRVTLRHYS
jgi:hypothetical protein